MIVFFFALTLSAQAELPTISAYYERVVDAVERAAKEVGPENVLLVSDVDETLLTYNNGIATEFWWEWSAAQLERDPKNLEHLRPNWVHDLSDLRMASYFLQETMNRDLTQPSIPRLLQRLRQQGIPVVALTSQDPIIAPLTLRAFDRLGIPTDGFKPKQAYVFRGVEDRPVLVAPGGVFTAGQNKGEMLKLALELEGLSPKHIVFVDNHESKIATVAKAFEGTDTVVEGFYFTRTRYNEMGFRALPTELKTRDLHRLSREPEMPERVKCFRGIVDELYAIPANTLVPITSL